MRAPARARRAPSRSAKASGPRPGPAAAERLQKLIARAGLASRREAEAWISAGRLTINGSAATLGARVGPRDEVRLDGRVVRLGALPGGGRVFLCHRSAGEPLRAPAGAALAPEARPGLIERLPRRAGRRFISVSPMPRVDGGLELLTSDGALALRLQRGAHALLSAFSVRVRGVLAEEQCAAIRGGELDSGARLAVEACTAAGGEAANRWYTLRVRGASGKEVRQLFERHGALVSRVLRTHFGPLTLERSLGRGRCRELSAAELAALEAQPPAGSSSG
ncbi:MAG TPA: S4 domain-containing protein [Steroidobacteraceae bacterium]|nr:S4 domain-containing protein [Steroidobacteraceae bacterium]